MLLAVLCFASCEKEEDKEPSFDKYFRMEVTRCERVSDVLIVDFKMKNISGKDLQEVQLNGGSAFDRCKDDLGETYYSEVSYGGDWATSARKSMKKDETITGSFRIASFDKTNSAKKLNLNFNCYCANLDFQGQGSVNNVKIVDNRVLFDGIDTNDFGLEYKLVSAERKTTNGNECAYITFTVKNNTGENLRNVILGFNMDYDWRFKTDTKDSFGQDISADGSSYGLTVTSSFKSDETKTFVIRISGIDSRVKNLTGAISCETDSYVFSTKRVNFYDIAID